MQAARQQAKNPTKLPFARYITEISFTAADLGVNGSDTGLRSKANAFTNGKMKQTKMICQQFASSATKTKVIGCL